MTNKQLKKKSNHWQIAVVLGLGLEEHWKKGLYSWPSGL